ncbi:hypothetical protein LTR96_006117 [Exophiala xenobiotica]|uniref:Major facilitator superfamily (MFS) profile domain-containing protein n=1 Tax=Vermiconidia calcicola TaxID=1690605 RepID=A0AAV9QM43_9PEZI|nr:hypothetical protein LTR92_010138 [Exophiala xenobiotica]KAK5538332.1 hypothetical protein LTR23_006957 [Chaetothyriales sp. CCFEE 6169]KAK5545054.1 hypothetical protein LTR25_000061 [Vermiconidia calcicola]KAK5207859.1 hypothetical protein LTR41_006371 [Exophiala xenobiotica]KAK5233047.1 hypothetical protein LTR47_005911 [Exophiala xenobiotica]
METFSNYNTFVVLFAAVGSLVTGYGMAVIGNTLGQPTFYSTMKLVAVPTAPGYDYTGTIIGAANGTFFGAGFIGCLIAAWMVDFWGRVSTFRIAAILGIIGGAVQGGAANPGMYLAGRALTGIPVGMLLAGMPIYFAEVAPPHSRGLMAGAHGTFINLGYALAAWIGFACYYSAASTFGWRFPNSVFALWAVLLLIGTIYIPESPRWLVQVGRVDQALKILCRLHQDANDPEDSFAHRELELVVQKTEADRAAKVSGGRWQLLTKKSYRTRFILALMLATGGQNCGILVINNYNVLLYQSLGLTGSMSLLIAAIWNTVALIANAVGAWTSDRTGRRRALVWGYAFTVGCFVIATGLIGKYSETPTKGYAAASVVFLFLYVTGYGSMIDVNQFTVISEIFPSHIRGEAACISIGSLLLVDVLWLELQPVATRTIGWKYYIVFVAMGIAHFVYFYFFLPETSGVALEELDRIFGEPNTGDFRLENRGDVDTVSNDAQNQYPEKTSQRKSTERQVELVSEA